MPGSFIDVRWYNRYRLNSSGFSITNPLTFLFWISAIFTILEWLKATHVLPDISLPGFDFNTVQSVVFLGMLLFSALFFGPRCSAYFLAVTWVAYFCKANAKYSYLDIMARAFFAVENWIKTGVPSPISSIPIEDLAVFANLLVFLVIAYFISRTAKKEVIINIRGPGEQRRVSV